MFRIRATLDQQVKWKTSIESARAFFDDLRNFAELMPGVERITTDSAGVACWIIRAEMPVVGATRQVFSVYQSMNTPARIEWSPASSENNNFLRYSAAFEQHGPVTLIRVAQQVELRRPSARALHTLAAIAGEERLSAALQKMLETKLQTFLQRACIRLEGNACDKSQIRKEAAERRGRARP